MSFINTLKKPVPNARSNLTSPISHAIDTTTELSLMVQEEKGVGAVTVGQSQAKMQLDWDVVQKSSDLGND